MLRAGKAKPQESSPTANKSSAAPVWSAINARKDSDESDNEDRVPVPQYHASFNLDIEAALNQATAKTGT